MRKFLTASIVLVLSTMNYSCQKAELPGGRTETASNGSETAVERKDPLALSEDQDFIDYVVKSANANYLLTAVMKKNSLQSLTVIRQVNELSAKPLSEAEQISALDNIFKGKVASEYADAMRHQAITWKEISARYKPVTQEVLQQECFEILFKIHSKTKGLQINSVQPKGLVEASEGDNCDSGYALCASGVIAAQIVCNIGCDAITLGWGAVACFGLCGLAASAAAVECERSHCSTT